jgi:predicted metallopeptidase
MGIKYELAPELKERLFDIVLTLKLNHVQLGSIECIRSYGSGSYNTIARCHALSKIWQKALKTNAFYIIELLSEKFDKQNKEEQDKTLIHELLHIPKSFGGGFKHHDFVCKKTVDEYYKKFRQAKQF